MRGRRHRSSGPRRHLVRVLVLGIAVAGLVAGDPAPVVSGPRPPVPLAGSSIGDPWVPPAPHVGSRFVTLPYDGERGPVGTWVIPDAMLPLRFTVEQVVADRLGIDRVRTALESFEATPGSRFSVSVAEVVDTGVEAPRRDGVSRVFLEAECPGTALARTHLYESMVEKVVGRTVAWVAEVDVGVCHRLDAGRAERVLRHEVGHVAGLGHLCNPGEPCYDPAMGPDTRCRLMNTAASDCQAIGDGERDGLVWLYPRVPRLAGTDRATTLASVTRWAFPDVRAAQEVVAVAQDASPELEVAAAALAATAGEGAPARPLVSLSASCELGPGGQELNRLAVVGARVVLVGDVSRDCEEELRLGWDLETSRLHDLEAVTREVTARLGSASRIVLYGADTDVDVISDGVLAVPVATALGAPVVPVAEDGLGTLARDVLDASPDVRVAVLVGGSGTIPEAARAELTSRGIRLRDLEASNLVPAAVKVSRMVDVFGRSPDAAVFVGGSRPADGLAAAALAAWTDAPVVPVWPDVHDPRIDAIASRVAGRGFVVGGPAAVPDELQVRLSRQVDGP